MLPSFTRTLRLKVRPESYGWLSAAPIEVNQVFNFCNEASWLAITRTDSKRKGLSGFDLCSLTAGAARYLERIGADTIRRNCVEYAQKRTTAERRKLRWRVSRGARRSLGWVPVKAASLKRKGRALRSAGRPFECSNCSASRGCSGSRAALRRMLGGLVVVFAGGIRSSAHPAPDEWVGVDLELKETAVGSEGERLESGRFYRSVESQIAQAQRRGHRRQAKRLHRKAARRRADAIHKFSRQIIDHYEYIVVGDVSRVRTCSL